jgi:muramoyltetrapeptide carboxypeptidase
VILPRALGTGSRVALVAPAGPVDDLKIETALDRCRYLGLEPVPGANLRARQGYLAGTDAQRAADLQAAVDSDVDAIWAVRGGYGTFRTLRNVDLRGLVDRPRPFIGFSDNTAVHLALLRLGLVSFHGPHAGYEHFPAETERAFRAALMEPAVPGRLALPADVAPVTIVPGTAEGRLVGGNLALLAGVCGTPYQPDTRDAILFLEDVDEPLYRIDRLLEQLRMAGLLHGLAGVAVGEFTEMVDPVHTRDAGGEPSLQDLLAEVFGPLGVPTVMDLPFGHGRQNWTLPLGVRARLQAGTGSLEILGPATAEQEGSA